MAQGAAVQRPSSTAQTPVNATSTTARRWWILGPRADLLLIVGSPILVIAAITLARNIWSGAAISAFVMVWAIGHHLPGMMRAYGDPALFRRFRVRFLIAPLVLLAACTFAFVTGVRSGVIAIAAIWGWWHYLMQAYGFARIYDSKVGSFAAPTRWLDQAMCLTWFSAAVVLNDNALYGFIEHFYNAGLAVPSASVLGTLRSVVGASTAAITVSFFLNMSLRWRAGEQPSWTKVALMATTFGCFWYSAATVTNIVVAYAFFELFHDIQYLTIVWAFNRGRAEKDKSLRGFTPWLFQARVLFIGLYLLMIFGYGSLKYGSTLVTQDQLQRVLAAVFLTSTLLHYYFDGFIWKLREKENQHSLSIARGDVTLHRRLFPPRLRHAMLWLLFLVPFGYLAVSQVQDGMRRHQLDEQARLELRLAESQQLADALPKSFRAHFTLGLAREYLGDIAGAIVAYQSTLDCCPDYGPASEGLQRAYARQRVASSGLSEPQQPAPPSPGISSPALVNPAEAW
jgi:hypothetical protein